MMRVAALAIVIAACGSRNEPKRRGPLPSAPVPVDVGQQPLVNPLNLWEMMIEGSPDHETVGFVGEHRVTTTELDRATNGQLTRIGERIYQARDRGWRALLEAEGLARSAAARKKTVGELLAAEYAAMPAPTKTELAHLVDQEALADVPPAVRLDAARSVWRMQEWLVLRSILVDEGLRGVPRERAQLMLIDPAFAAPATAIGKIGERVVTRTELHLAAGYDEQTARVEYYEAARMAFEAHTRDVLLAEAARAAGIDVEALLRRERERAGKPSRAEVAAFVAANPEYGPHPDRAADAVRTLKEAAADDALVTRLASGGVRFVLTEPTFDPIAPAVLAPRVTGKVDAKHVIEVLHCVGGATCEKGSSLVRSIVERYGDRARVTLGDYFSGSDALRLRNAIALRCADDQKRGWPMFLRLLDVPTQGTREELLAAGAAIQLDAAAFRACLDADRHVEAIVENKLRAEQLGLEMNIVGIWIDGRRLERIGDADYVRATLDTTLR
jgi:hypothetical protein